VTNSGRVRRTPDNRGKFTHLLNALAILAIATALLIGASTEEAPAGHWWGMDQVDRASQPKNVPTWETHGGRPGFDDISTLEAAGVIPSALLVVRGDGSVVAMSLDEVFERNGDDNPSNDVWTVGWAA
jgi:hypothetical protein